MTGTDLLGHLLKSQVDGRAFEVIELTEGFVVIHKDPSGVYTRKAALDAQQVKSLLIAFGLPIGDPPEIH